MDLTPRTTASAFINICPSALFELWLVISSILAYFCTLKCGFSDSSAQCASTHAQSRDPDDGSRACLLRVFAHFPTMACLNAATLSLQTTFTVAALFAGLGESQTLPPPPTRKLRGWGGGICVFVLKSRCRKTVSAAPSSWQGGRAWLHFCLLFSSLFCLQKLRRLSPEHQGTARLLHPLYAAGCTRFDFRPQKLTKRSTSFKTCHPGLWLLLLVLWLFC